ncbi:inositol monophosphatase family protein [Candidatus Omnitrophota bacterium]
MKPNQYTKVAIAAAKEAGRIHLRYFRSKKLRVEHKKSAFDLLTSADLAAEKRIVSTIKKRFPGHNFLAEESKYKKTNSRYRWIIDPLDGTNNFAFGLPIFCVSIACAKDNQVFSAVIYDPVREELFYAEKGRGAYLNGKKIQVNATKTLKESLLVTGFYYNRGRPMVETLKNIKRFFYQDIVGIRRLGSAALDLSYLACGRISGFWEYLLNPWDFAAAVLIIKEAGGRVSGRRGEEISLKRSYIVASNGKIHNKMLNVLIR